MSELDRNPLKGVARMAEIMPIIHWVPESGKWSDNGNDHWCHQRSSGNGWCVTARYGFDGDPNALTRDYPTEREAMQFFVSYLYHRVITLADESRGQG